MKRLLLFICRLVPVLGLVINKIRFPGLKSGLRVEFEGGGQLIYGLAVEIGEGTRIEVADHSKIVVGDGVRSSRNVHIVSGSAAELRIGAGSTIQDGCRIYGNIDIGRRCILAPNVFLSSGTHVFDVKPHLPIQVQEGIAPAAHEPIRIYDDCWLGINAVISRGVTVGRGSVVGANAVVTKDVPPYSVVAGNPAQVIRSRLAFEPPASIDATREEDVPYFYDGFDFVPGRCEWMSARGFNFMLALKKKNARGVRICVAGEGGDIHFGKQRSPCPTSLGMVEFQLVEPEWDAGFLHFSNDSPCRIYRAELF
jgi:acetyltransferase-like isoleucine patch superfamily enzyme